MTQSLQASEPPTSTSQSHGQVAASSSSASTSRAVDYTTLSVRAAEKKVRALKEEALKKLAEERQRVKAAQRIIAQLLFNGQGSPAAPPQ